MGALIGWIGDMRCRPSYRVVVASAIVVMMSSACGTDHRTDLETGRASASRGKQRIQAYGCGSCHQIPGIDGATGMVGPSLEGFAKRTFIAGQLPNTNDSLVRWIMVPQSVSPGNAMPNLGVSERDARDIAAYLATLR